MSALRRSRIAHGRRRPLRVVTLVAAVATAWFALVAVGATPALAAPPPPTNVAAAPINASTIHVSWTDNSGGTAKYVVSNGNVSSADLPAGTRSYNWGGLSPGTYMCFTVAAKNTSGQSAWSPYACVTTPALSCQATLQQADSSGYIYFFHGTAQANAKDIATNGINLSKGTGNADFGGGF